MKKMKKLVSLVLAMVMVLAMTINVSAATIDNQTEHSYNAYQVFSGTQADGSAVLGDIKWGTGVDGDALLEQLKEDYDYFDNCNTAMDVAEVLKNKADKCAEAQALANAAAMHLTETYTVIAEDATPVELAAGYYLLVDTTDVDGTEDARNSALLQVTNDGDITIEKKYEVPSVDKDIIENDEEVEATDANIGDDITFRITGTLPSNYADYETYTYIFHDTMSAGLTYNDDAKVYVVNDGVKTEVTSLFAITESNGTITVSIENLKVIKDVSATSSIVVEYSAELNSEAVIGQPGNPNKVYLEYSNDPNYDGDGTTTPPTGETPEDTVIVFTYELDVDKVDGETEEALKDAEFVLMNSDKSKVAKIEDGKFVEWVADSEITKNTDGTYPAEYTVKSDANGEFSIAGLDEGVYYLKETKAPAGYNLLTDSIKIEIISTVNTGENTPALEKLEIKVDDGEAEEGSVADGKVETTVVNNAGATLPETGGMGTTLFYLIGGILVLLAVIVFITKKRMSAEN